MATYSADLLLANKIYTAQTVMVLALQLFAFLNGSTIIDWEALSTGEGQYKTYQINCHVQYLNNKFSLYLDEVPNQNGIIVTRIVPRRLNLEDCAELIFVALEEIQILNNNS